VVAFHIVRRTDACSRISFDILRSSRAGPHPSLQNARQRRALGTRASAHQGSPSGFGWQVEREAAMCACLSL
jgi:hypothetical protein